MIQLKKILVPYDYSKFSQQALRYALELADKFSAEVYLLHVYVDPTLMLAVPEMGAGPIREMLIGQRDWARRELEQIPAPDWQKKLTIHREVREGNPFVEIVRYADSEEMDLIVLGTHGRTGLSHLFLGSVAERVVRKAPCPVLTVHHPEHEFIAP